MNSIPRSDLIKRSIKFRVLRHQETLFVNMSSALKDHSFSCHINKIDEALNKELNSLYVFTKFYIDGKELITKSYFTNMYDNGRFFNGVLSDGTKINCRSVCYEFESITPTTQELKALILNNVEDF